MADPRELPEPDAVEGAPHPRLAARLFGHAAAVSELLAAEAAGRMHHAWLISGPRGVGKATLAWKAAAWLLGGTMPRLALDGGAEGTQIPELPPDDPVRRRMLALAEPRLLLLRRIVSDKGDQLETQITVRALQPLRSFLQLSATDGGRRVVIVDSVDELNISAANAVLKILEEPPTGVVFLLISHQPQRLLPTIRSRCRPLRLGPLSAPDLAQALDQAGVAAPADPELAELALGSAGEAVRLIRLDGLDLWRALNQLMDGAPGLDRTAAIRLADGFGGRSNEPRLDLMLNLVDRLLGQLARAGLAGPGAVRPLYARLSPGSHAARLWAEAAQELGARARRGKAVNLDPGSLILDTLLRIDEVAARLALRPAPR